MLSRIHRDHQATTEAVQRLLADVHDSLGQELTALQLSIAVVARQVESGRRVRPDDIALIAKAAERAVGALRDITRGVASVSAENGNLPAALAELAARTSVAEGIQVRCEVHGRSGLAEGLASRVVDDAYRLAQEAVANALRHSCARTVVISLRELGRALSLAVTDDGRGFDTTARGPGIGFSSMHERARWLGGSLSIRSTANHGTTVECVWPLDGNPRRAQRRHGYDPYGGR
jgi:signal transduction histidine kinase